MNAAQLTAARKATEANLTDYCTVVGETKVDSGYGTETETPKTPVRYKCKVQQKLYTKPTEQVSAAELAQVSDYLVKLPWDAVITPEDRIVTSGGITLEVIDVPNIATERFVLNVDCKRIYAKS